MFEGLYEVSDLGRVRTLNRQIGCTHNGQRLLDGRIRCLTINKHGYVQLLLYRNGASFTRKVHRLVMLTFKGESKLFVNHKNGIKTDNRLGNLEYVTAKENIQHAYDTGLIVRLGGEDSYLAKLTAREVTEIRSIQDTTQKEIGKLYGVSASTVSRIRNKRTWK